MVVSREQLDELPEGTYEIHVRHGSRESRSFAPGTYVAKVLGRGFLPEATVFGSLSKVGILDAWQRTDDCRVVIYEQA